MAYKILLVDDEPDILEIISYSLESAGYKIYKANNGLEAIKIAKKIIPDLIIMDLMMPHMNGIDACDAIRKSDNLNDVIITFLSARGEDFSKIAGFEAGADDYITKPIKPKVLLSKVKALLRRKSSEQDQTIIQINDLIIDRSKYSVNLKGIELNLPRKEFELLYLLVSSPNTVFTREKILDVVWGSDVIVGDRTIDVHIRKIREKIGASSFKTIKGVGYKFVS
ncbi:response regulator transcription factor [Flavobacteriaceae bacterium]|jgi:two-component system, OmpR family, alkaline phosphatase synthesis response regulator PhoP|nr:DNA-binding response regulator [Flavobacteriaceae bacterium]MDA8626148.1 response regulator transcription factor [Flavobacteriaceae bacterium]MDC1109036.1 response regulator transcription factor [Flavobacteriaceae bacterium]RZO99987.1 MAG: response regulator transcription factor [Flavobacteriales bacterium]